MKVIFILISIIVPLLIIGLLPRGLRAYGYAERPHRILLYVACALFFISYYLPSPLIEGRDTSFMTHLIGGGVFTGFLWLYLKRSIKWNKSWYAELASLYALVSALGCLNELAELAIKKFELHSLPLDDTNWDILANTLGVLIFFGAYELYRRYR